MGTEDLMSQHFRYMMRVEIWRAAGWDFRVSLAPHSSWILAFFDPTFHLPTYAVAQGYEHRARLLPHSHPE